MQSQRITKASEKDTVNVVRSSYRNRDLVKRLKEYLLCDNNLTKTDITREELIDVLGTNRNTLSKAVRIVTGNTLMQYIRELQLEEARRLLDDHPELTVETIAYECGFKSSATFYRHFRKQYGQPPTGYRNKPGNERKNIKIMTK